MSEFGNSNIGSEGDDQELAKKGGQEGAQKSSGFGLSGFQKSSYGESKTGAGFNGTSKSTFNGGQKPAGFCESGEKQSSFGEFKSFGTQGSDFGSANNSKQPGLGGSGNSNGFENKPSGFVSSNVNSSFGNSGGQSKFGNFCGNPGFGEGENSVGGNANSDKKFGQQNCDDSRSGVHNDRSGGHRSGNSGQSQFNGKNGESCFAKSNANFGSKNGGSHFKGSNGNSGFGSKTGNVGLGVNGGKSGFGSGENSGYGSSFGQNSADSAFGQKSENSAFGMNGGGSVFKGNSTIGGGGNDDKFDKDFEERKPMKCHNCREEGHRSSDCAEPPRGCFNCGQQGHNSKDCTEPPKPRESAEGEEGKLRATFIPEEEEVESVFDLQKIQEGVMFRNFFDAEVTISFGSENVEVEPLRSFEEVNLPDLMLRNVKHAGYSQTTPIQQFSIPLITQGFDMLACSQTGSGKTAAFLLPIMNKLIQENDLNTSGECGCFPRCIILAPTRELANQIYNEGRKFAYQTMVQIKAVYGGVAVGHSRSQLESGASIIVGTVGRIKHFIDEKVISLDKLRYFVLDEADRMIENMDFGDDITYITQSQGMPNKENRQTLMFSATFPDSVQTACREYMKPQYAMLVIDKIGTANKCVTQDFVLCESNEKREKLLELLGVDVNTYSTEKDNDVYTKKTIVFVSRRSFADSLAVTLTASGIPAITIHGAREQSQRDHALRMFRNGSNPVLIATAVAERGLDIKGVDHVINYDMPDNIDNYIHRIGRTGRVGNAGRATSFLSSSDSALFGDIETMLNEAGQIVPSFIENSAVHVVTSSENPDDSW